LKQKPISPGVYNQRLLVFGPTRGFLAYAEEGSKC